MYPRKMGYKGLIIPVLGGCAYPRSGAETHFGLAPCINGNRRETGNPYILQYCLMNWLVPR